MGDKDLGFYFQGDMMRKLETSKPVRRTRVDAKPNGMGAAGGAPAAKESADAANGTADGAADKGGYLFKWQRDQEEEEDEENEKKESKNPDVVQGASWARVTGNLPPSALSIGPYLEKGGPKGKHVRDTPEGELVSAGGVIILAPDFGNNTTGNQNKGVSIVIDETKKDGSFNHDDLLLRTELQGRDNDDEDSVDDRPRERLWFHRPGPKWPPDAPAFPPPPPNMSEIVGFKKVARNAPQLVKRLSRVRPDMSASRDTRNDAVFNTPQFAAAMAGGSSRAVQHMVDSRVAASDGSPSFRGRSPSSQPQDQTPLMRTRAPSTQAKDVASKKGGFIRRISFMPGMGSSKANTDAFAGEYALNVQVPYALPPPPEPRKPPPSGSNEDRKLQKVNLKLMFLEDMYSSLLEASEEKLRIAETCRQLETQITDMDFQITTLLGSNE